MVKHIILWTLKSELSDQEKQDAKKAIKDGLEGLAGQIDGLESIKVTTDVLGSSNTDIMLESIHIDVAALDYYAGHPLHVDVKNTIIVPKVSGRYAIDFEF